MKDESGQRRIFNMQKRIVIFGGSFHPPGLHHRRIVELLAKRFNEVVVIPCGPRPDKSMINDLEPVHRAAMSDLNFRGIPNVRVDLEDLEHDVFTRTIDLDRKFKKFAEVWHCVGSDLLQGGGRGKSVIHKEWKGGNKLWNSCNFAVVERPDYTLKPKDLPPRHMKFRSVGNGSSTEIRNRLLHHQSISGRVHEEVQSYIQRHGLYHGRPSQTFFQLSLSRPRILLVTDSFNSMTNMLEKRLRMYHHGTHPECIVVLGGDGTMLKAIREHWHRRIPFLGIHTGHKGYLMNHVSLGPRDIESLWKNLVVRQSPLLYVEAEAIHGERLQRLAFNDAWVERKGGQAAWIKVSVNHHVRIKKLIADGVLVATAAGSSAYARAMGGVPLYVDWPGLVLIGSNVSDPNWKSAHLPLDARVEFETLDQKRRPIVGYADSDPLGDVTGLSVRTSRVAAVELAFIPSSDLAEKLTQIQFPS